MAQNLINGIKFRPFSSPPALGTQGESLVFTSFHLWLFSCLPFLDLISTNGEQEDKLDVLTY